MAWREPSLFTQSRQIVYVGRRHHRSSRDTGDRKPHLEPIDVDVDVDVHVDVDAHVDVHVYVDVDAHMDVDVDVDAHMDVDVDVDAHMDVDVDPPVGAHGCAWMRLSATQTKRELPTRRRGCCFASWPPTPIADRPRSVVVMQPDNWEGYLASGLDMVDDEGSRITIAGVGATSEWLLPARCWVITAHNPFGITVSDAENQTADRALSDILDAADLERRRTIGYATSGQAPSEDGWLVAGTDRDRARELGARFDQDAVYEITPEELILVPCDGGSVEHVPRVRSAD